jgi:hypothetical protein
VDNLQFVASLVSSLVWPVTVVVVALVFRGQIGGLIGRLQHLKAGPVEAWARAVTKVGVALATNPPAVAKTGGRKSMPEPLADIGKQEPAGREPVVHEFSLKAESLDVGERIPLSAAVTAVQESLTERFADMADREPAAAVTVAWVEVDKVLRQKVEEAGLREPPRTGEYTDLIAVQIALDGGVINGQTATAIRGLVTLRNLAAHGSADDLDPGKAFDFLTLADAVIFAIEAGEPRRAH